MNLKLLEKLVRLANNNPNEHEANLAARRACKLIQEANFKFLPDNTESKPAETITWNDVVRSTEPFWRGFKGGSAGGGKSEPRTTAPRPEEYVRNWEYVNWARGNPFVGVEYEPVFTGKTTDTTKRWDRQNKTTRRLKCKTCSQTKDTIFVGAEELFECNECQWEAYRRTKT